MNGTCRARTLRRDVLPLPDGPKMARRRPGRAAPPTSRRMVRGAGEEADADEAAEGRREGGRLACSSHVTPRHRRVTPREGRRRGRRSRARDGERARGARRRPRARGTSRGEAARRAQPRRANPTSRRRGARARVSPRRGGAGETSSTLVRAERRPSQKVRTFDQSARRIEPVGHVSEWGRSTVRDSSHAQMTDRTADAGSSKRDGVRVRRRGFPAR